MQDKQDTMQVHIYLKARHLEALEEVILINDQLGRGRHGKRDKGITKAIGYILDAGIKSLQADEKYIKIRDKAVKQKALLEGSGQVIGDFKLTNNHSKKSGQISQETYNKQMEMLKDKKDDEDKITSLLDDL